MSKLPISDYTNIQSFYDDRCKEHGDSIVSVGWKDQETQFMRFEQLVKDMDLEGKTILDLGCGFGDFIEFLDKKHIINFQYIGIDLSNELLSRARVRYAQHSQVSFFLGDIFEFFSQHQVQIDIIICSGMLSYKIEDNLTHARAVIELSFQHANEAIAFNFLTDKADYYLEKNFHYDCVEVLSWLKPLSNDFKLNHNYPLWEFTIQLYK